ncbi:IMPACT family protein [Flagellimonas allohymeniacidonis]|uniref:YigZ family protein n=1 Tax=Flagellimonas allohymeniacidonis TaxID=2517819 RepID=A0A4Q8QJZ5_9FLAO|nr:YigZ family protein [Allomuricauda hymeniacidonis]TAI49083.1 YigZ family protein [Allomuricauda hymeniacidonis]
MENGTGIYKTLTRPSVEILFKDRKSKFFGYAFPIQTEEEVKPIVEELRKKHASANHVCYAWQLGIDNPRFRANDDGEPNNSAGMPIYGQIQSFGVTNLLVAVVRIFGGTKLGVGGLIQAYRAAAEMALDSSDIEERTVVENFQLDFSYSEMSKVMRMIKQHPIEIESQKMEMDCCFIISVPKSRSDIIFEYFNELPSISIRKI